jgi:hypothetical protein
LPQARFERCVYINCPFDKDYQAILQAILFCISYLGFQPRIATERQDAGEIRLRKINKLIKGAKYSIHDLSRCQAEKADELYRLNMPFELGMDYGCRRYSPRHHGKRILILAEERFRHQKAISDLAGCDVEVHEGDYQKAVRKVRNWLVSEAGIEAQGAKRICDAYTDFQEWYYEKQLAAGFSDEDIQDYPTSELMVAMRRWISDENRVGSAQARLH